MRSFWSEPFIWIHLAGLAALPIFLEICWLGLALGDTLLPTGIELLLVAAVGILPVLWMQLFRPFYIFSVVLVALKPEQLPESQRLLLPQFKKSANQLLAVVVALFMLLVLWQLYKSAPIAAPMATFMGSSRVLGLILAGLGFLASNLFLQIPLSVLRVLLTKDSELTATEPYPVEQIPQNFSILGWQVNQILPPILTDEIKTKP